MLVSHSSRCPSHSPPHPALPRWLSKETGVDHGGRQWADMEPAWKLYRSQGHWGDGRYGGKEVELRRSSSSHRLSFTLPFRLHLAPEIQPAPCSSCFLGNPFIFPAKGGRRVPVRVSPGSAGGRVSLIAAPRIPLPPPPPEATYSWASDVCWPPDYLMSSSSELQP